MNILGAHAYTSTSGLALEVYRLSSLKGGEEEREIAWAGVDKSLVRVLRGDVTVSELRKRRGAPLGRRVSPMPLPVRVSITNDESDFYTIIDVTANDRLGLLHDLTRVLASHGCAIYISKAGSVLDQVTDTFYIKDQNERKLHDDAAIEALRRDLLRAAEAGESDAVS